jgi:hypothetical protein
MNRMKEWMDFSGITLQHIRNYTIPQFGDVPNDNLSTWSIEDCLKAINRYVTRNLNENRRGQREAMRDMVKIAHYACVIFWKMYSKQKFDEAEEHAKAIEEGR